VSDERRRPDGEGDEVRPAFGARRGMSFSDRLRAPDSYGLLLIHILVLFFAIGLLGGSRWGRAVLLFLQGAMLLFAFRTSAVDRRLRHAATWFVVGLVVVGAAIATGTTEPWAIASARGLSALLTLAALGAILLRIGRHPVVSGATVLGALCAYLLIGLTFTSLYGFVDVLSSGGLFAMPDPTGLDLLYFSFVTLTTVGYGDLVAADNVGRMLAISEALIGQLYLVTIVALVVGNIGTRRRARP
jgi:hypothetical protein